DTLAGGAGDDTYRFGFGSGADRIVDGEGFDVVEVDAGVSAADLRLSLVNGSDLLIRLAGSEDRLLVTGSAIDELRLADGTVFTIAQLLALAADPEGDNLVTGSGLAESLAGAGGADTILGLGGDDLLDGGTGDDSLEGGSGNDTYRGGAGHDRMVDVSGDDTYIFNRGDGQDWITDSAGFDVIAFGPGIAPDDLSFTQADGADIVIRIAGGEDRIRLVGALSDPARIIEDLRFADGSTLAFAQVLAASQVSTGGADSIRGSAIDDTLSGGLGDDTLDGGSGDDLLLGGGGGDSLIGGAGNDTLEGHGGADTLAGGLGDDVYRFAPG
ncbi:MAG TPA: calcium-binding protein, partial [Novosphingobium sp.]|nr:calcium-binding protein [Novosphingobium sp.]